MSIPELLFYLFATIAVGAAVGVVTVRNTVYSVLYLVLAYVATAVIWMLLETEFLALILVLVYVGAVMTLFLFVVMMLDLREVDKHNAFVRAWPLAVFILLAIVTMIVIATSAGENSLAVTASWQPLPLNYSNVTDIGNELYTTYVWPFEIAAVLLLAAIVAAITLAHRKSTSRSLQQDPVKQGRVNAADRIRIVKMKSEN